MDPRGTMAMKDDSFGSNWRPGASVEPDRKLVTGRRSFFRRGAAAAASAVAAATFAGREAFAGNPNYLPSLYLGENVREFQAIQTHENAHVAFLVNALGSQCTPSTLVRRLHPAQLGRRLPRPPGRSRTRALELTWAPPRSSSIVPTSPRPGRS